MQNDTLITARQVKDRLGGVSDMTIWRWAHNAELRFPEPIRINRRKYYRSADIDQWLGERDAAA